MWLRRLLFVLLPCCTALALVPSTARADHKHRGWHYHPQHGSHWGKHRRDHSDAYYRYGRSYYGGSYSSYGRYGYGDGYRYRRPYYYGYGDSDDGYDSPYGYEHSGCPSYYRYSRPYSSYGYRTYGYGGYGRGRFSLYGRWGGIYFGW